MIEENQKHIGGLENEIKELKKTMQIEKEKHQTLLDKKQANCKNQNNQYKNVEIDSFACL